MLSFALTGAVGCVLANAPDEVTLVIASVLERPDAAARCAWVLCVVRDGALRDCVLTQFGHGDRVRIEGEIEQRRRAGGAIAFHSVGFVAHSIVRLAAQVTGEAP
jgi:hypothetical protein